MWPFDSQSARRKEIRRSKIERTGPWHRRMFRPGAPAALTVALLTAAAIGTILNAGGEVLDLRERQSLPSVRAARVAFALPDAERTQEMRLRARDASPTYYKLDETLVEDIRGRLLNLLALVKTHRSDADALRAAAGAARITLDDAGVQALLALATEERESEFVRSVEAAIRTMRAQPLVEVDAVAAKRTAAHAVLVDPLATVRPTPVARLVFASGEAAVAVADTASKSFGEPLRPSMRESLAALLRSHNQAIGLYRFDPERTESAADAAHAAVPMQYQRFAAGSALVDAGPISEDEVRVLQAEHAQYQLELRELAPMQWRLRLLARFALVLVIVVGVTWYTARDEQVLESSFAQRLLTAGVLTAVFGAARWALVSDVAPPSGIVGAQALCAALLSVIYAPGIVMAVGGGLAALLTLATGQGLTYLLMLLAVTGTLVWGLRDVRYRGHIVLVGGLAALVALAMSGVAGALNGETLRFIGSEALWAAGSTLLAALVIEGVLPAIERIFRVTTGMTLLEWCDASKPLIRMLASDAPGTYNHSLLVGTLAESAAEAIGANGLLARAGGFYHDIGKINKPEYFVENQLAGAGNRHDRLSPKMSLIVILGHVKDGVEMAREYGLPPALRHFIAEHHGTTLVEYFYHAANKARRPGDPEIPDSDYRYPGPKPHTREIAIVMLCDGVEGAVRAMSEPTPARIESVVVELIRRRLVDGQLDECDLTFHELGIVEKSLVKSLCALYHSRITYPDSEEPDDRDKSRSGDKSEKGRAGPARVVSSG